MEDIKAKVLQLADKKTLIKIGISVGSIIVFLIIYYAILNPMVNKRKLKLDDMNKKKEEIAKYESNIKKTNKTIKKLTPEYKQYSTLFHTKAEVEGLYQTLSYYAGLNGLVISSIKKEVPAAVSKASAPAKKKKKKKKKKGKKKKKKKATKTKSADNVAYYKIPVTFEITGNFLGYIKFKRALSLSKKMLNFDKESIQVVKGDTTGAIKVTGKLTIVGLDG